MPYWLERLRENLYDLVGSFKPEFRALNRRLAAMSPQEVELWYACWDWLDGSHPGEPAPPACRALFDRVGLDGVSIETPAGGPRPDQAGPHPG